MEKIQKTDRRTRYTCQTIKDILLEELKTKPYSKITVTEICKKAEMNRGTFYLHYYDIDDVLNDILEDFLSDTSSVLDHVLCPYKLNCTYPFCEKIRSASHYQVLFFDDVTAARMLEKLGVQAFYGAHQAGTISFVPREDCEAFAQRLADRGIAVRAGLHCAPLAHESAGTLETGTVRVSFGPDAADWQTDALINAVGNM